MRKFSAYGLVDTDLHTYMPRAALIDQAHAHLLGKSRHNQHPLYQSLVEGVFFLKIKLVAL